MQRSQIWKDSYWYRTYKTNRFLFVFVVLFFVCSLGSNLIKLETTPFFVWRMYSAKLPETNQYTVQEIWYNQNKLVVIPNTWQEPRKLMIFDPLHLYIHTQIDQKGNYSFKNYLLENWGQRHQAFLPVLPQLTIQPDQWSRFPGWFLSYLSKQVGEEVEDVHVVRKQVEYQENGNLRLISVDTVLYINRSTL